MSAIATRVRPQAARVGGVLWLVFMVGMWIAFFVALVADRLDNVWHWARDLPLLVELVLWLLTFPWLLGTAVWQSSWPSWPRVLLVVTFAVGWTLMSIPRQKDQRTNEGRHTLEKGLQ
jgi:hypothetical protein